MQVSTADPEALKEAEAAIESLEDSAAVREYTFEWPDTGGTMHEVKFTQAPLGMFPAQEFITMMTRIVNDVLEGKYEVDIMELFRDREKLQAAAMPDNLDQDAVEQTIEEWKPYIQGFLKLVDIIPEFQQDIIALSLGVRRKNREEFKERISEAPYLGGLEIDDAVEIIKVFIRQNAKVLRRFLGSQIREMGEELMKALEMEKQEDTTGGTQSSTSTQPTQESA
jgi:hypothetical protein